MKNQRRTLLLFFFGTLAAYLFMAAGYIDTIDADPSVELARSLIEKRSVLLSPDRPDPVLYSRASENPARFVSKLGLGSALVYVPSVLLSKALARVVGPNPLVLAFLVSLTNCFVTALLITLLLLYFLDHSFSTGQAVALSLMAGFTTLLLPYSKTCQREPLQALCLVGVFVFARRRQFFSAAFWMGFGLSVKSLWLVPAIPFFALACAEAKKENRLFRFLLPFAVVGAALPIYQWWGFGSAFKTGYNLANVGLYGAKWSTPFFSGLFDQVISWRSGFFVFNPLTLFCFLPAVQRFRRGSFDFADLTILLSFALQACLYASWFNPMGGWNLGPRYLVTVLPVLFLLYRRPSDLAFFTRRLRLTHAAVAFCFLFQFIHTAVKPQQYWELVYLSHDKFSGAHWVENTKFFLHKLTHSDERYQVTLSDGSTAQYDLQNVRSMRGFNFWWLHWLRYRALSKAST